MFYHVDIHGEIGLEKLRDLAKTRIWMIHCLSSLKSIENIHEWMSDNWNSVEKIFANDVKDAISFNMALILAAIRQDFLKLFIKGEKALFLYRLSYERNLQQLKQTFTKLENCLIQTVATNHDICDIIMKINSGSMIEHFYNNHRNQISIEEDCYDSDENNKEDFAFNDKIYENAVESPKNEFNSNCKLYEMRVPFQLVPELVATRSVILRKGFFRIC